MYVLQLRNKFWLFSHFLPLLTFRLCLRQNVFISIIVYFCWYPSRCVHNYCFHCQTLLNCVCWKQRRKGIRRCLCFVTIFFSVKKCLIENIAYGLSVTLMQVTEIRNSWFHFYTYIHVWGNFDKWEIFNRCSAMHFCNSIILFFMCAFLPMYLLSR